MNSNRDLHATLIRTSHTREINKNNVVVNLFAAGVSPARAAICP